MLSSPGSSLRWQVPHCSYQCLTRRPEALACSFLSVCLTLWDSNGACISTDFHCAFSIFVSLSHSLSMFSFLVGVSQFVYLCVHRSACICTTFICFYVPPHLEFRGLIFGLRIYLYIGFMEVWVLYFGAPLSTAQFLAYVVTFVCTLVCLRQIISLWHYLVPSP